MADPSGYDWTQFHVAMYYPTAVDEVFSFFATARGLERFFIKSAVHTRPDGSRRGPYEIVQPGDVYHWQYVHDLAHGGTFELVERSQRLKFSFGSMMVDLTFQEVNGSTLVDLHQTGCSTIDPDRAWQHVNCRSCWIFFFMNLRSIIAGGSDLRDHDHPQWNDSISIGWERS
jgi:uncharacterized protein YndB with AHSA1/START domain